jgi:ketosteroid isomerase-like protein
VKKTTLTLCITLIATSVIAANFASDEQALRRLDREHAIATYMAEVKWFRQHLADDYVLLTADGTQQTKAQLIEALAKPGRAIEAYETTDVQIRSYGSTAIVTGRMIQKTAADGERVIADLRYSDVWIKTAEGWINVSGQISPISIKRERVK